MTTKIGTKALMPNPALKGFEFLVGEWHTTGSHPFLPGETLRGRSLVEWLEGGAFLIIRSEIDNPKFPDGVEILGSDELTKEFFMLHFDSRGVSRKYNVTLTKNGFRWTRDDPNFSQRFTLSLEKDGKMVSSGEMSRDGAAWEKDLELTYERIMKDSRPD